MKNLTLPFYSPETGKKLYHFLIVISPPDEVMEYVNRLKKEFYEKYGPYQSMGSTPHITICNFLLLEERQNKILTGLQDGLLAINPFLLKMNGFGIFHGSNVIYLNVEESEEFHSLGALFDEAKRNLRLGKSFEKFRKPHLTIAKKIKPDIFELCKADYLPGIYQNTFTVNKLTVLRKELKTGRRNRYINLADLTLGNPNI